MGLGGINISELLVVLVIVVLIFGTKRLKSIGSDLGGAIKGFRSATTGDDDKKGQEKPAKPLASPEPDAEFPEQKQKSRQA